MMRRMVNSCLSLYYSLNATICSIGYLVDEMQYTMISGLHVTCFHWAEKTFAHFCEPYFQICTDPCCVTFYISPN